MYICTLLFDTKTFVVNINLTICYLKHMTTEVSNHYYYYLMKCQIVVKPAFPRSTTVG